jgi:hypothetical protein
MLHFLGAAAKDGRVAPFRRTTRWPALAAINSNSLMSPCALL